MDDWCDATGESAIGLCDGFLRQVFEDDIVDVVGDDFKLIFVGGRPPPHSTEIPSATETRVLTTGH